MFDQFLELIKNNETEKFKIKWQESTGNQIDILKEKDSKYGCSLFHWASIFGNVEIFNILLASGASVLDSDNSIERSALHYASRHGNMEVVKILISKKVPLDAEDNAKSTALSLAMQYKHVDIVLLLLSNGVIIDPNHTTFVDELLKLFSSAKIKIGIRKDGNSYYQLISSETHVNSTEFKKLSIQKSAEKESRSFIKGLNEHNALYFLLEKYIYLKTRYKKYERDKDLGKKDENITYEKHRLEVNLRIIRLAINLIDKRLCEQSDSYLKNCLEQQQKIQNQYFGDELSDDSDEEDARKIREFGQFSQRGELFTPTKRATEQTTVYPNNDGRLEKLLALEKIQQKPDFWIVSGRVGKSSSPSKSVGNREKVNSGLTGRLKNLVERYAAKEIQEGFITESLLGRKKTKTIKELKPLKDSTAKAHLLPRAEIKLDSSNRRESLEKYQAANHDRIIINSLIERDGELKVEHLSQVSTKFYIAQYRGINYMIDRWSADARRYHRQMVEEDFPQFTEVVLKTLPYCFYTQLSEKNDFTKNQEEQNQLIKRAYRLLAFLLTLGQTGPCIDYTDENKEQVYFFDNVSDRLQHRFSNGINSHLMQLQKLREQFPAYWGKYLPSAHNPSNATGDRPYHALKYTFGLKDYYDHPILPRYQSDGRIEYSHVGKVYVSLHALSSLSENPQINRVSQMDRSARITLLRDIGPEKESSFAGLIEEGCVFYEMVAKFPSLQEAYSRIKEIKYGLDYDLYTSFQFLIRLSQPNSDLRNLVVDLLSEWLCSYHEVTLIEIARKEAEKRGGILVYLNSEGFLSFEADKGLLTQGDENRPIRNSTHIRRDLRRLLSTLITNNTTIVKDETSFPGFTVVSKDIVSPMIQEISRSDQAIDTIVTKVTLSKAEEAMLFTSGARSDLPVKRSIARNELAQLSSSVSRSANRENELSDIIQLAYTMISNPIVCLEIIVQINFEIESNLSLLRDSKLILKILDVLLSNTETFEQAADILCLLIEIDDALESRHDNNHIQYKLDIQFYPLIGNISYKQRLLYLFSRVSSGKIIALPLLSSLYQIIKYYIGDKTLETTGSRIHDNDKSDIRWYPGPQKDEDQYRDEAIVLFLKFVRSNESELEDPEEWLASFVEENIGNSFAESTILRILQEENIEDNSLVAQEIKQVFRRVQSEGADMLKNPKEFDEFSKRITSFYDALHKKKAEKPALSENKEKIELEEILTTSFKKLSMASSSTMFNGVAPTLLVTQFNDEEITFERHFTRGDGSCGFYALPIAGDREGARKLLLDNFENEEIRRMVGVEIREAVLAKDLPEVLLNNDFYRQWLLDYETLSERSAINAHDQRLVEYTETIDAYRDFINNDTGGQGRLGFNAFAEETSVLDALARLANLRIHIFHDQGLFVSRGPEAGIPTFLYHYEGQDTHFELMSILEKKLTLKI